MMEKSFRTIEDNVKRILDEIGEAAVKAGRRPENVQLMAVTKTQPPELVNAAIAGGIRLLGENRAQELLEKYDHYHRDGVGIHFIGHLQTNKVRQIVDKVDMIHSVDSVRLAEEIQRQGEKTGRRMDVLIEVNVAGELSKSGVSPQEVEALARSVGGLPNLRVKGLMTIPPFDATDGENEAYFDRMAQLLVDIRRKNIDNVSMTVLSMGMSGDYLLAVRHGSTLVRVGSAIFGARQYR